MVLFMRIEAAGAVRLAALAFARWFILRSVHLIACMRMRRTQYSLEIDLAITRSVLTMASILLVAVETLAPLVVAVFATEACLAIAFTALPDGTVLEQIAARRVEVRIKREDLVIMRVACY